MVVHQPATILIQNAAASLHIDLFGGAIIAFRLAGNSTNPLSFAFTKEQMPINNGNGAPYQGHFSCIGRWGEPSAGEIKAGLPNHGEPANIEWVAEQKSEILLSMQTTAKKEGLHVDRTIIMDKHEAVYKVSETITNINPLGRLFNIVQHPSLAAPFLDGNTIVDCNASIGFDQAQYKEIDSNIFHWPVAKDNKNEDINLRNPSGFYNAVFSFVIQQVAEFGWITAYSPAHNLLIGYVWKRADYPWIHIWRHYDSNNAIQYLGIEFGTAGIHKPFDEILKTAANLFGEKTVDYIDAGESVLKKYFAFIYSPDSFPGGVRNIEIKDKSIVITPMNGSVITMQLSKDISDGL